MSTICHLDDIKYINKLLSDSLTVSSGQTVESMKYVSSSMEQFNEKIAMGVMIIFKNEQPIQVEFCDHVTTSIQNFIQNNSNLDHFGIGVIYDIKNISSEIQALKMIENYLSLIFKLQ